MQKLVHNRKKGFTLIELIVVMAVIAILVLLAAPRFLGYTKDANTSKMQADVKTLSNAALQYNINNEDWPSEETEVEIDSDSRLGLALTAKGGIDFTKAKAITPGFLNEYVKNTGNPIEEYILLTDGNNSGEVFHIYGVEDSKGMINFGAGVQLTKTAADAGTDTKE